MARTEQEGIPMTSVRKLDGIYNDERYWERVNRSLCWLGEGDDAQRQAQQKLSNATVGIAGCGGIGGALVMRLARLGVRHLKIADPDSFDWTNINRQFGSGKTTIGKNKAETVGNLVWETVDDVTIEIFRDGITKQNAAQFVDGCDLVLDQMDFYLLGPRYALHREFRARRGIKCIISAWCIGWGTSLFKYTHDGMPIEEYFDIPEESPMDEATIIKLMSKFIPLEPRFPSRKQLVEWFVTRRTVPLFAGTPPVAEAAAVQRVALILTDLEREPYATPLPPAPSCYVYDGATFEGGFLKVTSQHRGYSFENAPRRTAAE
jgi:molybdopterin/thiamine biosynthesis adenylyltransferase